MVGLSAQVALLQIRASYIVIAAPRECCRSWQVLGLLNAPLPGGTSVHGDKWAAGI